MNVLVCDDHRLFGEALSVILDAAGYRVVACVATPDDAVEVVRREPVDLCLMDLYFPSASGVDGVREVRRVSPGTRVLLLSSSSDPVAVERAVAAGASGLASKADDVECILELVRRAMAGETIGTASALARGRPAATAGRSHDLAQFLTMRELEVLERLVQGESTAALAKALGVRYSTARTHIQSLLTKLGVHSKLEAVAYAVREGIVTPGGAAGLPARRAAPGGLSG